MDRGRYRAGVTAVHRVPVHSDRQSGAEAVDFITMID